MSEASGTRFSGGKWIMFEKIVNYLSKQLDITTEEIREDPT